MAQTYVRELVSVKKQGAHNLRSSLALPSFSVRVTLWDRSFYFATQKLWNALPRDIRSLTDVKTFKYHLKTYLLKKLFINYI